MDRIILNHLISKCWQERFTRYATAVPQSHPSVFLHPEYPSKVGRSLKNNEQQIPFADV
jgi:hypothetical protein